MTARFLAGFLGGASLTLAAPVIAQTAAPALPPATSGTYGTNSSMASVNNTVQRFTVDAKTAPSNSLSVTYDAATSTYRLSSDTVNSFGPAQANGSGANTKDYYLSLFGVGVNYKRFSIFSNPAGTYSYTRYGLTLTERQQGTGNLTTSTEAFVFGSPTAAASLPRSGAAYYTGLVDGWDGSSRLVNSTGTLLANFYTGEIATGLNLSSAGSRSSSHFEGRGLITAGTTTFSGSLFGNTGDNLVGGFNGGFYGPAEQEVGLTFALAGAYSAITGAFVGVSTPVPGGSVAPPAPPIQPINSTLVAPLRSETFFAIGGEVLANLANNTDLVRQSAVARTETPGDIKIAYDATSGTYTMSDNYASTNFAAAAVPTANGATTTRTNTGSPAGQSLVLSVAGSTNPRLALTYLSYGLWLTSRDTGGLQNPRSATDRSFIYGVETPAENLPRSGAALYNGEVAGTWTSGNSTYRLAGRSDGSILANFYTGEVRTTMALTGTEITSNAVATLGRVDGYGSIAGGTAHFNGTMTGTDNVYSGNFQGAFYGPAYQEAGASFALTGANGAGSVNGVIVAGQAPIR